MLNEGSCWNSSLVRRVFSDASAKAILNLSLSVGGAGDSLFWPLEDSGDFSVKSAHRALVKHRSPSITPIQSSHWCDLWKLKLHDRLKLLLWKVVWDLLPTKQKVALRIGGQVQLVDEMLCELCGEQTESLHHLLFVCPYSQAVWSESPWQLNIVAFEEGLVEDWIRHLLHPHHTIGIPLEDQHLFQISVANTIDMLWADRNRVAHGGQCSTMV